MRKHELQKSYHLSAFKKQKKNEFYWLMEVVGAKPKASYNEKYLSDPREPHGCVHNQLENDILDRINH